MAKSKYKPKPTWNTTQAKNDGRKQIRTLRLSQCMIVKNEEKNIEKALSWAKGIAYEQIVVDTGSSDRTIEIAESMGAKVYHFEWIDDFSAAKNFAIDQAKGDWIVFLDADEYFSETDAQKLIPILVKIETDPRYKIAGIISTAIAHLDDEGHPFQINAQTRIFRNHPALRYKNPIHENLTSLQPDLAFPVADLGSELTVFHTGYAPDVYKSTGKLQRNIKTLREELESHPDDPIAKSYLADALLINSADDCVECEQLCRDVIAEKVKSQDSNLSDLTGEQRARCYLLWSAQCRCYNHIFLINEKTHRLNIEEIRSLYERAIAQYLTFPDFDFFMGEEYYRAKDYQKALACYLASQKKGDTFHSTYLISRLEAHLPELYRHTAACYEKLGDLSSAIRYATLTLKLIPYDENFLFNYIGLSLGSDPEGSAPAMLGLLRQLYDFTKLKDKLLLLKVAKRLGVKALYDGIYSAFTPEERTWFEKPAEEEQADSGFIQLMEMIAQTDEDKLFSYIKNAYMRMGKAFRDNLSAYYNKYGFWGSLNPEVKDFTVFRNRAHELKEHFSDFLWLYEQLGDARSKNVLYGILSNWVNMDINTLDRVKERRYPDYFDGKLVHCSPDEVFVDLGGYIGDTVLSFINTYGKYKRIYTYEIMPSVMEQLKANTAELANIEARSKGAGDKPGVMYVSEGAHDSANTLSESGETSVEVVRIDDDITEPVTFIKMDIEGSEQAAIRGCERHIREEHPKLAICTYHNNTDIWKIPRMIHEMDSSYKFYMRYNGGNLVPTEYVLLAL